MLSLWRDQLLPLFTGPTIWSLHFLACYILAAIVCQKSAGGPEEMWPVRLAIAGMTAAALAAVAFATYWAYHQALGEVDRQEPYNQPTKSDRRQFLGYAQLLLNGLSAVAIIYNALPALVIRSCL